MEECIICLYSAYRECVIAVRIFFIVNKSQEKKEKNNAVHLSVFPYCLWLSAPSPFTPTEHINLYEQETRKYFSLGVLKNVPKQLGTVVFRKHYSQNKLNKLR